MGVSSAGGVLLASPSSPYNHAKNKTPNPEKPQPVAYLASDTCQTRMMLSV